MNERSAIVIVCNGHPFLLPQLCNIYDVVDEIIVVEGPDHNFQKVIGSNCSNDGTMAILESFRHASKIQWVHTNCDKNQMVRIANSICRGRFIYHVDVDEFMPPRMIEQGFAYAAEYETVAVPQRWYYKWSDTFLTTPTGGALLAHPARFFRNHHRRGLSISHIPASGYYTRDWKWVNSGPAQLGWKDQAAHYLALCRSQIITKVRYYLTRDGGEELSIAARLREYDSAQRDSVIQSYYGAKLTVDPDPPSYGLPWCGDAW